MAAPSPSGNPDAWGLVPASSDSTIQDAELGFTTSEDGDWGYTPVVRPVTRTFFAMALAHYAYGTLRTLILTFGLHRRRP